MRQFLIFLCILSVLSCIDKPGSGPKKNTLNIVDKATDSLSIDDFEGVWINNTFARYLVRFKSYRTDINNCNEPGIKFMPSDFMYLQAKLCETPLIIKIRKISDTTFLITEWPFDNDSTGKIYSNSIAYDNQISALIHNNSIHPEESVLSLIKKGLLLNEYHATFMDSHDLYSKLYDLDSHEYDSVTKFLNDALVAGIYKNQSGREVVITDYGEFISENENFNFYIPLIDLLGETIDRMSEKESRWSKHVKYFYEWDRQNLYLYHSTDTSFCPKPVKDKAAEILTFQKPYTNILSEKGIGALRGCWLSKTYLDELKKTKSPYKASMKIFSDAPACMFHFEKTDSNYVRMLSYRFHEGIWFDFNDCSPLHNNKQFSLIDYYENPGIDDKNTCDSIQFLDRNIVRWQYGDKNNLEINDVYVRVSYDEHDYNKTENEFVRNTVLAGMYRDKSGNNFEFSRDGTFSSKGFSSKYVIGLNHVSTGFDYIDTDSGRLEFKWKGNKLYLYEVQTKNDEWPQKNYNKKPLYVFERTDHLNY